MRNLKNSKFLLSIVIFIVFIINVIQGSFTELLPDEAYYWIYSQHIDWGFFDHPPLVALWIYISDFLFAGELGVRFVSAVSFSLLTYIVWITIDHPKKKEFLWLFLLLFFSTALLNVYGFITTPDAPLMLFSGLFLFAYKQYLTKKSTFSYLLLSFSIAAMLYSKYQGILIVFFVLLSNWKLIKDYKLWLVALGALLLYIPHLHWQWMNDFPSFRYHLQERVSNRAYKFEHTLMHFVNIIAIVGLTFPILYKAFFKNIKTKDAFSKSLNFIILGFLIFFFFSSFRGRVQAQWIVPISIPLILIGYDFLIARQKSRMWFVRLATINIAVMLIARIFMMSEAVSPKKLGVHGNEKWAKELQSKIKGQEKIFINSYQHASAYWYYTKETVYYMKNFLGRNNHFVILQKNQDLSAKQAALISRIPLEHTVFGTEVRGKDSVFTTVIADYKDLTQLEIHFTEEELVLKENSINTIPVVIQNNFERSIHVDDFDIYLGFRKDKKVKKHLIKAILNIDSQFIQGKSVVKGSIRFEYSLKLDPKYYKTIGIGITNSKKIDIIRASKLLKYTIKD